MTETIMSLNGPGLSRYVAGQVNHIFPDGKDVGQDDIQALLPRVFERLNHCFSVIDNKYFFDGRHTRFNHLHGDQYAMFLYWLSREAHLQGAGADAASKLFLLNKSLHGIDVFYEVVMPDIFLFVHPLATVLGRAHYADHLLVYQRCSVGSNHDIYPTLGKHVTLRPGSSVLGAAHIGEGSTMAAESMIIDRDVPPDTVYMGRPGASKSTPAKSRPSIWRDSSSKVHA